MTHVAPQGFDRGVWQVAASTPDLVAVSGPDGSGTTFGGLVAEAHRLAHGLRQRGLRPGDGVAVMAPNRVELLAVYLACIESGLYFVPVTFHLVADEVGYVLENSGARVLVVADRFAEVGLAAADRAGIRPGDRFAIGDVAGAAPLAALGGERADFLDDGTPGAGGVNIHPAEVEGVLLSHPELDDAAVFGVPDDDWGQRVHALVAPAPGADRQGLPGRLEGYCREHLAGYKVPRAFEIRDSLPRTSAGKLAEPRLQGPYWQRVEAGEGR